MVWNKAQIVLVFKDSRQFHWKPGQRTIGPTVSIGPEVIGVPKNVIGQ